jgi:hypothetical protein
MPKLHELLAVVPDRAKEAQAILAEAAVTFSKKPEHFIEKRTSYVSREEDGSRADETTKEMVETVRGKLKHCMGIVGRALDAEATRDVTNQNARAAVVIGDVQVTPELPVPTLLMLESRIKKWIEVFNLIPTLAPGRKWELDPQREGSVYIDAAPALRDKTKKKSMHRELVAATQYHPAQIDKWTEDVVVGTFTDHVWCSMLSPADKSALLARATELLVAVKQARQKANDIEVVQVSFSNDLLGYLLG